MGIPSFFPAEDVEKAADWIIEIVTKRIPQEFGFAAIHDIQVLAPIYGGPVARQYTQFSRPRDGCALTSSRRAIGMAARNNKVTHGLQPWSGD